MKFCSTILLSVAIIVTAACSRMPDAGDFLAPEFGHLEVKVSPYKAVVSCSVSNVNDAFSYGFIFSGEGVDERVIAAQPVGDSLSVTIDELMPQNQYSISAFASSGQNRVASGVANFKTEKWEPVIDFPDPVFKKYIVDNYDEDGDGQISEFEALDVDRIEMTADLSSIVGVEYMRNLRHLEIVSTTLEQNKRSGHLVSADLSRNNYLSFLRLEGFHIKTLILPETQVYLQGIQCSYNCIEAIDLSKCKELRILEVDNNSLLELDISKNPKLEYFICEHNYIQKLDFSNNTDLRIVSFGNNLISSVDVTMLPDLRELTLGENPIQQEVDLSGNPELVNYGGNNIPIYDIPDLSHNPKLRHIHISGIGGAEYIDTDFFCAWPELIAVNLCGFKKEEINLANHSELENIWASNMAYVKVLDLSSAKNLRLLEIQGCPQLKTVYLNKAVDISKVELKMDDGADTRFEYK